MANAGWYNDETDPALARWHDGVAWTEHVLVKADWEGAGHEPPPPELLWSPGPNPNPTGSRIRMVVGSAAVLALLAVGGVAFARTGGNSSPSRPPSSGQPNVAAGTAGTGDTVTSVTDAAGDPTSVDPTTGPTDATGSGTASTTQRSTTRTTLNTKSTGAVQHTDTATNTHTNTSPITAAPTGDKSSVGNTTNTTIRSTYVTPPPTTTTSEDTTTTADTTPPATTAPTDGTSGTP